jgi:hypothetical protein
MQFCSLEALPLNAHGSSTQFLPHSLFALELRGPEFLFELNVLYRSLLLFADCLELPLLVVGLLVQRSVS